MKLSTVASLRLKYRRLLYMPNNPKYPTMPLMHRSIRTPGGPRKGCGVLAHFISRKVNELHEIAPRPPPLYIELTSDAADPSQCHADCNELPDRNVDHVLQKLSET